MERQPVLLTKSSKNPDEVNIKLVMPTLSIEQKTTPPLPDLSSIHTALAVMGLSTPVAGYKLYNRQCNIFFLSISSGITSVIEKPTEKQSLTAFPILSGTAAGIGSAGLFL
jgi:hypothetical protein